MFWKKKKIIVTHSSKFHPDDIFAVATLVLLLKKEGTEYEIIRTRDMEITNNADYVVDAGFIYDETHNRFDHHQVEGAGARSNGSPYASFGLVWKKYGHVLCGNKDMAQKIDKLLIEPIDLNDNGIDFAETKIPGVYPADIRSLFYIFRPTWKEDDNFDEIFIKLVSYARVILQRLIISMRDEAEAVQLVVEAYNNSLDKRLIILEEQYPWEQVLEKYSEPLYVVYKKKIDNTWSLKNIRNDTRTYISRKDLPKEWAGKTGEEFEKITGVPDVVFCHKNLFLAVAKTKEAILKLAEIALKA